jgi:hypothetical protein
MNLLIKFLLLLIIIGLSFFLYTQVSTMDSSLLNELISAENGQDEDDDNEEDEERIHIVDGYKAIQLEKEIIDASGIKSEELTGMSFKPEFTAYADVIDIAPLVVSKTEYTNLLAEQKILQNDLHNYYQILKRAEALHKTNSLTTRELEKIRADHDLKYYKSNAMKTRLESFTYQLESKWGGVISSLILDQEKQLQFDKLASNKASLILLSLLKNQTLTNQQQKVFVSIRNQREEAKQASYLDQARQISNPLYGESYIYLLNMRKLSAGLRLFAWVEEEDELINGLFLPDSAVIWYANEPWIYIKYNDELFVRRPIGTARKLTNGWLLEESLMNDTLVVTSGGQTLLSEEFKWAIPDEDAD